MQKEEQNWFASWFNTDYYHILYRDRDYEEAKLFMTHLTNYLNIPEGGSILDLACGKGRHSVYLNSLGFDITGADLSENSIQYAKQFENDTLKFTVHDMSQPFGEQFDAVFNLFTSFGYFENEEDNLNTLKAIQQNLKTNGFAVIDFMNVDYVIDNLVAQETKTVDDIDFHIERFVKDGHIFKEIKFFHDGKDHHYTEKVKALRLSDFEQYFDKAGVTLLDIFGDFKLNKFQKHTSDRLIMIFK